MSDSELEALRREAEEFRVTFSRALTWIAVVFASIVASALWPGVWGA